MSKNPNNPRGLSGKEIFRIFAIYFVLYSMLATLGFWGMEFFLSTPGIIILLVGWVAVPAIGTWLHVRKGKKTGVDDIAKRMP